MNSLPILPSYTLSVLKLVRLNFTHTLSKGPPTFWAAPLILPSSVNLDPTLPLPASRGDLSAILAVMLENGLIAGTTRFRDWRWKLSAAIDITGWDDLLGQLSEAEFETLWMIMMVMMKNDGIVA